MARSYRVPRECMGVDENPNLNGGRYPTKAKFPTREIFSETTTLQLKDGSRRKVVRQKQAHTPLARFAATSGIPCGNHEDRCDPHQPLVEFDGLPLYSKGRLPDWQGPELPLYLEKHPTPGQYRPKPESIRGNASALGVIEYLAQETDLRAMRRLAKVGRAKYAQDLAPKDRLLGKSAVVPLFEPVTVPYGLPTNTASTATQPAYVAPLGPDKKRWEFDQFKTYSPPPIIWTERDKWGVWAGLKPVSVADYDAIEARTDANRRMALVAVAAEQGNTHEKPQRHDPLLTVGDLHRVDGGDRGNVRQGRRAAR
jgi:hypothetical protein